MFCKENSTLVALFNMFQCALGHVKQSHQIWIFFVPVRHLLSSLASLAHQLTNEHVIYQSLGSMWCIHVPRPNLGHALDLASSFPVNNPGKLSVPYRHREQDKSIRRNPYCFVSSFFDPFLTAAEERWFRMTIATFLFRKTKKRRHLQHPCITHRGVIDRRSLSGIRAWPRGLGMCRLLLVRLVISLGCVELRVSEVIVVFG